MKAKLGTGARFKSLVQKIKQQGGAADAAAVAASIGRKKYGDARMVKLANAGRKQ